jgi:hypothetical protein
MILASFILMILSRMLWVLHDLYFWGPDDVKAFVKRVGWHNIKMLFMIAFFLSAYSAGNTAHGWSVWRQGKYLFALALAAWGGFEGLYNILNKDARLFDWARYLWSALTGKEFPGMPINYAVQLRNENRFEFVLHHVFRLHWIEAIIIISMSIWLTLFFFAK